MSLAQRLQGQATNEGKQNWSSNIKESKKDDRPDKYAELKMNVHREVIDLIEDHSRHGEFSGEALAKFVRDNILSTLERDAVFLPFSERQIIANELMDEVLGLGPIEPLLREESVTEVMVNGPKRVYVERGGKIYLTTCVP